MKVITILLACSFILLHASCDNCKVPAHDNYISGDVFYGQSICSQPMIDQFWYTFGFDKENWDHGFGYEDPCNIERPLARTFNALYLMAYSAEDWARTTNDFSGSALRWAYPYCATTAKNLDGLCGDGTANATFFSSDKRIELYYPFFYQLSVSERAGTLLHETRHKGGKKHNGGDTCKRKKSCDTDWAYEGANMYQVLYLWWFAVEGTRTTTAMKSIARNRARTIHNNAFNTSPGFNI